jgi:hypothetical protein
MFNVGAFLGMQLAADQTRKREAARRDLNGDEISTEDYFGSLHRRGHPMYHKRGESNIMISLPTCSCLGRPIISDGCVFDGYSKDYDEMQAIKELNNL